MPSGSFVSCKAIAFLRLLVDVERFTADQQWTGMAMRSSLADPFRFGGEDLVAKKYILKLTADERSELERLVRRGPVAG